MSWRIINGRASNLKYFVFIFGPTYNAQLSTPLNVTQKINFFNSFLTFRRQVFSFCWPPEFFSFPSAFSSFSSNRTILSSNGWVTAELFSFAIFFCDLFFDMSTLNSITLVIPFHRNFYSVTTVKFFNFGSDHLLIYTWRFISSTLPIKKSSCRVVTRNWTFKKLVLTFIGRFASA